MDENSQVKMSLKLMVDTEKNKVVFAEADNHFVDILFSFLTLPVGTIVQLLGEESPLASAWSLGSLYRGADGLNPEYFTSGESKEMLLLLLPRNAAGRLCSKLKLNIDDSEPIKYFCCCITDTGRGHLSLFKRARCSCKRAADEYREIKLLDDDETPNSGGYEYDGVFIKTGSQFLVTDDIQVTPGTFDSMHLILNNLGISEIRRLKCLTLKIGSKEITQLLELSLFSKSPLTDMFLRKEKSHVPAPFPAPNKLLYAEAKEDFIDLLFSILTLPLGAVVELFGADSSLTSIDNLYKSVGALYLDRWLLSDFHKSTLMSPKLPPTYKCKNPLLDVQEMNAKLYYHNSCNVWEYSYLSKNLHRGLETRAEAVWMDPKAPTNQTVGRCGYVKEPANFMVTDDLTVMPLSPLSTIGLLYKLGLDLSSLVQREISVGREEALCLLKASLISTSVLTTAFIPSFGFLEPKQELN